MKVRGTRRSMMSALRPLFAAIALAIIVAPHAVPAAAGLSQLRGVPELKSWFNSYKGRPRLILLLSPT